MANTRQYFIPGWGYINEVTSDDYFIPGWGYINETAASNGGGGVIGAFRRRMGQPGFNSRSSAGFGGNVLEQGTN